VRLLVEGARDRIADVDAYEVHQLERPHAEPGRAAADPVYLLGGRYALLHDPQRLERERPVAAVDEEAGLVGGRDHVLAQRLADRACPRERRGRARGARDELHQAHLRDGVEEVQAHDTLGSGHPGRDLADREGGGVGRQHRVGRDDLRERREQRPLDLERLGRRLDHHVARRQVREGRRPLDAHDPALGRRIGVVQQHPEPRIARGGGDAGAHRPGAGDPEAVGHARALMPVSARPMISFWICDVPS
jgi:hypothetical protein